MTVHAQIIVPRQFTAWRTGFAALPETATERAKVLFQAALDLYFSETQAVVHVDTGALKASGRVEMDRAGFALEGAIVYGDEAEVVYAQIENDRGGDHAYLDIGWEAASDSFNQVMPATWQEVVAGWR